MVKVNMMSNIRDFGPDWQHIDKHLGAQENKSTDIYMHEQFAGSIDLLYCSHGVAYFDRRQIEYILQSWFRVIRSGGILRIATPDWDVLRNMGEPLIGPLYGFMESAKEIISHKTCYTFVSLCKLLADAGFTNIRRYDHRTTEHPNTGNRGDKYDDHSAAYHNGTLISLNLECTKP